VVLGLLFGVTFGVAIAGWRARRTDDALPRYLATSFKPDAACSRTIPRSDAATRDAVASLPTSAHIRSWCHCASGAPAIRC
jgi:hypothetical protein